MADVFSTDVLRRVVDSLLAPPQFLLDRFFPIIQTEQSEEIHFDVVNKTRRIAPFVSPMVAGKVVESQGFSTKTFKPAYIKDKRVFDMGRPLKRSMGEPIGGTLSPAERLNRWLAHDLVDQIDMVNRRLEVMASEALRTGQVTISGEFYPTQVVSFGRDAGLTVTLAGGSQWGDAGVNPLDDLQDWSDLVLQKSGAMPVDVVMSIDVWKVFRADANVKDRLDVRRVQNSGMDLGAQMEEGGTYRGTIDGYNIFTYAGWYIDDAGAEQPIMPAGSVILGGAQIQGVRAFGAIRDEVAGLMDVPYFSKSWVEQDPSVRYLLMQSAPIVVPHRVNASLFADVL